MTDNSDSAGVEQEAETPTLSPMVTRAVMIIGFSLMIVTILLLVWAIADALGLIWMLLDSSLPALDMFFDQAIIIWVKVTFSLACMSAARWMLMGKRSFPFYIHAAACACLISFV